jgi:hypothetical protein
LGITGFDSPIAQNLFRAAAALESIENSIKSTDNSMMKLFKVLKTIKKGKEYLKQIPTLMRLTVLLFEKSLIH